MALIQVPSYGNFKLWFDTTNLLGLTIGDLDLLDPALDPLFGGATDPNLVSTINSLLSNTVNDNRLFLARTIAMS